MNIMSLMPFNIYRINISVQEGGNEFDIQISRELWMMINDPNCGNYYIKFFFIVKMLPNYFCKMSSNH